MVAEAFAIGGDRAGVPVMAVGVGDPDAYRDIRVVDVQAPSLTFLHYPADVTATIQVWGYAEETLAVVLQRDGRVVARAQRDHPGRARCDGRKRRGRVLGA